MQLELITCEIQYQLHTHRVRFSVFGTLAKPTYPSSVFFCLCQIYSQFPPSPPFSTLNLLSAPGKEKLKYTRLAQLCCHHQGENRAVEIKGGATCGNESPPFLGIPPILHATQLCTR